MWTTISLISIKFNFILTYTYRFLVNCNMKNFLTILLSSMLASLKLLDANVLLLMNLSKTYFSIKKIQFISKQLSGCLHTVV
jgi:hypothetical protein